MTSRTPVLSLVIPVYNEAANIEPVVHNTISVLGRALPDAYEIVIVDDGSTDESYRLSIGCANRHSGIRVCRHEANRGLGAALKTGYMACTGEYVSFIPGDGEVEADQVLRLFNQLESADLIISRRNRSVPLHREILTAGWWFMIRLLFGFFIRTEGIYVVRRKLLHEVGLERMDSTTGLLNIEIVMRAIRRGCRWKQAVIDTKPRLSGASKVVNLGTTLRTLKETVKLRLKTPS